MVFNKSLKTFIASVILSVNFFGFFLKASSAYPVFAQQSYSNPRAANGKLACANCHLNQKAIEIESPQAVLPNSVFEIILKVPYDLTKQQIGANGKKANLNVGGIVILPNGFKLASKDQISDEIKTKNKGVFISPYSTDLDNVLVVGPISGKSHQELIFPIVSPDPKEREDVKYLTYPIYIGGNRGRGQVYPTGEKSNLNIFSALQSGTISEITTSNNGERNIIIITSTGQKISQVIPAGLILTVKSGEYIQIDQALNVDPNIGGFGQEDTEIVLQNPLRILGYLVFCVFVLLTQVLLILKKKQFEKVQAAELNF
jgi:apocytochrome f